MTRPELEPAFGTRCRQRKSDLLCAERINHLLEECDFIGLDGEEGAAGETGLLHEDERMKVIIIGIGADSMCRQIQ